jgi:hypothetical protein
MLVDLDRIRRKTITLIAIEADIFLLMPEPGLLRLTAGLPVRVNV